MKKLFMTGERDCIYDEVVKNDLIANGIYKEEDFYEVDKDGYPIEAYKEKPLKQQVIDGEVTVFKVTNKDGTERQEILDGVEIRDLTIGTNAERIQDLVTLYERNAVYFHDERYEVKCGFVLIADLICETAGFMKEAAEELEADEIAGQEQDNER